MLETDHVRGFSCLVRSEDWYTLLTYPVTDAHCHPTDSECSPKVMESVSLGCLAAMATADDQEKVAELGASYPWTVEDGSNGKAEESNGSSGLSVVASFGELWSPEPYIYRPDPSRLVCPRQV